MLHWNRKCYVLDIRRRIEPSTQGQERRVERQSARKHKPKQAYKTAYVTTNSLDYVAEATDPRGGTDKIGKIRLIRTTKKIDCKIDKKQCFAAVPFVHVVILHITS